jgi:hypothetical protein
MRQAGGERREDLVEKLQLAAAASIAISSHKLRFASFQYTDTDGSTTTGL